MAYPDKINALVDVTADQTLAAGGHAARHNDVNDALDELEAVFTAPAANELAFRPDGSTEAVRIDSSGNVGIGTTDPDGRKLRIDDPNFDDHLLITRSGAPDLHITTSSGGPEAATIFAGDTFTDGVYLYESGQFAVPTGPVTIGTTTTGSAGEDDLVVSGGIFLGGSAAGNELDDYEEGTWTPTFAPTVGSFGAITYDTATTSGFYTKIGRVVFIQAWLRTDAITIGTASGILRLGGLPFNPTDLAGGGNQPPIAVGESSGWSGEHPSGGRFRESSSQITLYYRSASDGTVLTSAPNDLATGANANDLSISGFYITS